MDLTVFSTHQQALTQSDRLNLAMSTSEIGPSGKGILDNVMTDRLQQLSDLQLNKVIFLFHS